VKSVLDRFKKIQDAFDKKDAAERRMSGVGGEVTEMEEILGMMAKMKDSSTKEQNAEKEEKRRQEVEKDKIGEELMEGPRKGGNAILARKTRRRTMRNGQRSRVRQVVDACFRDCMES